MEAVAQRDPKPSPRAPTPERPLAHLDALEADAISTMRLVAGERERPVLLFSGGKDSIGLRHLARKAFWPGRVPFSLLHVDTGHNFPETLELRDELVQRFELDLVVASVEEAIAAGRVAEHKGPGSSRNRLQIVPLLDAIREHRFDAALGGARRDEERARAKERVFSHRDAYGQWNPKQQRPELWQLFNTQLTRGEHFRVFPISDWTELDVWSYIARERIELPSLYFAHQRSVFERDGMLYADHPLVERHPHETCFEARVRFRTIGDMTCTGALRSDATSVEQVIQEVLVTRITERGATRADDRVADGAMEDRKREGYF